MGGRGEKWAERVGVEDNSLIQKEVLAGAEESPGKTNVLVRDAWMDNGCLMGTEMSSQTTMWREEKVKPSQWAHFILSLTYSFDK